MLVVKDAIQIVIEHAIALKETKAARIVVDEGGNHDARRIVERLPQPLAIARPHRKTVRIMTSGRQSIAVTFLVSEYQYMDVSGAMPKRDTCARVNMVVWMSMTTPLPRVIRNLNAPTTEGPSIKA